MKILKIQVSGFRSLKDDFELDFLTKSKVQEDDKQEEVIELLPHLSMPVTTVFTGPNASGKSTVIALLMMVDSLLTTHRIKYSRLDFNSHQIKLKVDFWDGELLYRYTGVIVPPSTTTLDKSNQFCDFDDEIVQQREYRESYGHRVFDQPYKDSDLPMQAVKDTSRLYFLTNKMQPLIVPRRLLADLDFKFLFEYLRSFSVGPAMQSLMLKLFDPAIEEFTYLDDKELYLIKLNGLAAREYNSKEVNSFLSDGTKKGFILLGATIKTLQTGTTMVIDEIENSFHKNLVENIIGLFNDRSINKKGATLIFTTHYVEILDIFSRKDNIFIMKKDVYIDNENLAVNYKLRSELLKSNQFNNNTFGTLLNYNRLMDIKRSLRNEISHLD